MKSIKPISSFFLFLSIVCSVIFTFSPNLASAQSIFTPEQQIELVDTFNTSLKQGTSALVGFSSISSISSGSFTFDGIDGLADSHLDVYRVPVRYYAGEEGDSWRPFVELVVGHVRTDLEVAPVDPEETERDKIKTKTTSFGFNLGTAWEYADGFTLEPAVQANYTHFKRITDYNTEFTQLVVALEPFLDRNFFNTSVDIFSVIPTLRQKVDFEVLGLNTGLDVKYNYIRNTSLNSKSQVASFRSSASILQSKLNLVIPSGVEAFTDEINLKPFFSRTDLFADAKEGMGLSHYHEIGLGLDFTVPQLPEYLSKLELGAGYTFGEDFQGWRVGVSFL
ncbi:MAG: Solitary outer membrane autotransporter beta-barrel domain [Bdellovibrionales bacterium]|nr:Solitary outer membrane autotransporter beta-barrel domain [Bdellovibrionales bacterium]